MQEKNPTFLLFSEDLYIVKIYLVSPLLHKDLKYTELLNLCVLPFDFACTQGISFLLRLDNLSPLWKQKALYDRKK